MTEEEKPVVLIVSAPPSLADWRPFYRPGITMELTGCDVKKIEPCERFTWQNKGTEPTIITMAIFSVPCDNCGNLLYAHRTEMST